MIYRINIFILFNYCYFIRFSDEPPIHEGYLYEGKKNIKRWYYINTDGMFYINENNEKKMLCDLQLATVKDCYDKGVDREKSFMIILSNQTSYLFKTETKEDKQKWSTQLQIVLSLILEKGNLDEINPFAITYENKVELEKLYNVCADCGESNPV